MKKKKTTMTKRRRIILAVILSAVLVLAFLAVFLVSYFASAGYVIYRDALKNNDLDAMVLELRADENYITLDELPSLYKDGVVAIEDSRFYRHGGIDVISIGRAFLRNIKEMSLVAGGSTITQQLAKNLFFTFEKRFERKAAEVYMAYYIESKYSKEDILEIYVNYIDFGNKYKGVLEGSLGYFGREPRELSNEEIALLIGIPNKPACYAPNLNPEDSKMKQEEVLEKLYELGLIPEA